MSQNPELFFCSVINCPVFGEPSQITSQLIIDPDGVVPHSSLMVSGLKKRK